LAHCLLLIKLQLN